MTIDSEEVLNLDDCVCEFSAEPDFRFQTISPISFGESNIFYRGDGRIITRKDMDYFEESSR